MPDERDIEKALRAWAKRRREEAGEPLEMHPATRRLLQAEAARLKRANQRGPLARFLWGSPLRLVLNLSAAATLVIAGVLFLPQHRQSPASISAGREVLAENNREQNENPMPGAAANDLVETDKDLRDASKTKSNGNSVFLGHKIVVSEKEAVASSAIPGSAPPPPLSATAAVPNNSPATETAGTEVASAPIAGAAPAAAEMTAIQPPPVVQKLFWINSPTNVYTRTLRAPKVPAATPLLGAFRTEQTGNRLRVVDADGSVYAGTLAAVARRQASNGIAAPAQTQSFRVSGTNVTSHQRVVFTGRLVLGAQPQIAAPSNAVGGTVAVNSDAGAVAGGGGFGGAGSIAGNGQTNVPTTAGTVFRSNVAPGAILAEPQFLLQGTVRIGTNQIQINAIPAAN